MSERLRRRLQSWIGLGRYRPLRTALLFFVAVAVLTRFVLLALHTSDLGGTGAVAVLRALLVGLGFDLISALYVCLPLALFLTLLPNRWLAARLTRGFVAIMTLLFLFGTLYLSVAEVVFFEEFTARFNHVAVDYLIYPKEVFINIRDTYPVGPVLIALATITAIMFYLLRRRFLGGLAVALGARQRLGFVLVYGVSIAALGAMININSAQVSDNRILNEIAGDGVYSFGYALGSNEAGYHGLYAEIDEAKAFARARRLLAADGGRYLHPSDPRALERAIPGAARVRPMNVVLVLEESLGSKYVPSLHPEGPRLMTEFDRLARDGLFFTRIYSTGNRTVRGIEATLASVPPLPGRSIVKRRGGADIFSLPSVLQAKGYQTVFLYGGRAYFDNIRDFALSNYYDRVLDQTDFPKITFTTIWGVCDEDLFDNALDEFDRMHASGRPFFATLLTVSNHSPFLFPKGRIAEEPIHGRREHAMRYADHAIGKFMRDARAHAFFDNTVFVFLGDHGARVYGRQEIPLESYEVPVLMYAPKLISQGRRVDTLGSQIDVAPTVLALLGFEYNSQFYGRDLLRMKPSDGRALMTHNRDVALLRGDRVAVLGILGAREMWHYDRASGAFTRLPPDQDMLDDAVAYYQSAYRLYEQKRLKPLAQSPLPAAPPHSVHAGLR